MSEGKARQEKIHNILPKCICKHHIEELDKLVSKYCRRQIKNIKGVW